MTQLSLPGIPGTPTVCPRTPWSLRRRLARTGKKNSNYRHGRITRTRLSMEAQLLRVLHQLTRTWKLAFSRPDLCAGLSELSAGAAALDAQVYISRDRAGRAKALYLPRQAWRLARRVLAAFRRLGSALTSPGPSQALLTTGNDKREMEKPRTDTEARKRAELERFWRHVGQEATIA